MTEYSLIDSDGTTRLRGTIDPPPGGSSPVSSTTKQLTNAQILALNSTDIEVIDAPGIGKALQILSFAVVLDTSAGAYVNPSSAEFDVGLAGYWIDLNGTAGLDLTTAAVQAFGASLAAGNAAASFMYHVGSNELYDLGAIENVAFCVGNIGDTDWTGGNAANTFSIQVVYRVADTLPFTA